MRFSCRVYLDRTQWNALSGAERKAFRQESNAYEEELRQHGFDWGERINRLPQQPITLRLCNGQFHITEDSHAETDEFMSSTIVLEARDLNHAIARIAQHPGIRIGRVEIYPMNQ